MRELRLPKRFEPSRVGELSEKGDLARKWACKLDYRLQKHLWLCVSSATHPGLRFTVTAGKEPEVEVVQG